MQNVQYIDDWIVRVTCPNAVRVVPICQSWYRILHPKCRYVNAYWATRNGKENISDRLNFWFWTLVPWLDWIFPSKFWNNSPIIVRVFDVFSWDLELRYFCRTFLISNETISSYQMLVSYWLIIYCAQLSAALTQGFLIIHFSIFIGTADYVSLQFQSVCCAIAVPTQLPSSLILSVRVRLELKILSVLALVWFC